MPMEKSMDITFAIVNKAIEYNANALNSCRCILRVFTLKTKIAVICIR